MSGSGMTESYERLCKLGDSIDPADRVLVHLEEGRFFRFDRRAMCAGARIYADEALREGLRAGGVRSWPSGHVAQLLEDKLPNGLIWGFSTYAGIITGAGYAVEGAVIGCLFDALAAAPSMVVHDGVSYGVSSLANLLARDRCIPTLGIVSLLGMAQVGLHDFTLVTQNSTQLVHAASDVWVGVGGDQGTLQGCESALRCGATVILMLPRGDYPRDAWASHAGLVKAVNDGRMFVCAKKGDIQAAAAAASRRATRVSSADRRARILPFTRL